MSDSELFLTSVPMGWGRDLMITPPPMLFGDPMMPTTTSERGHWLRGSSRAAPGEQRSGNWGPKVTSWVHAVHHAVHSRHLPGGRSVTGTDDLHDPRSMTVSSGSHLRPTADTWESCGDLCRVRPTRCTRVYHRCVQNMALFP